MSDSPGRALVDQADTDYPNFVEDILDDEPSAPAAPEAPTAPEATPAQPDQPPTDDKGQPRDAKGRFRGKPGDTPASPVAPSDSPAPDAAAPAVASEAPASPQAAPAPQAPTASDWSVRGDRQNWAVPGAKKYSDGRLEIPAEQTKYVEQLLAEGIAHRGSWQRQKQEYEQRIAQLEEARAGVDKHPDVVKSQALLKRFSELSRDREAFAAWWQDFERQAPLLMQRAEQAQLEAERDTYRAQLSEAQEQQAAEALVPQIQQGIADVVSQFADQYQGIDADGLYRRCLGELLNEVVYEVDPRRRPHGLEPGERLIGRGPQGELFIVDGDRIQREFAYQHQIIQRARTEAQQAATAAVRQNATAVPAAIPPTIPVGGAPTGGPGAAPLPKSKQELDKWLDSGGWKKSFPR